MELGKDFTIGETIILENSVALLKQVLNRTDVFAMQKREGGYSRENIEVRGTMFDRHLSGSLTIGAYQFDKENKVKWIVLDIDSHPPKDGVETEQDIINRNKKAERDMFKACFFLDDAEISYLFEKSGSPYSYHIWIFLVPTAGWIARYFVLQLIKEIGINCEVFPKQNTIGKDGYGNLVKSPLATHQKHKGKSCILVKGEWVREVKDLEIKLLDLSNYSIPEEEEEELNISSDSNGKLTGCYVRPCIRSAVGMNLHALGGGIGHAMRAAIVREYHNTGKYSPAGLAMLFKNQSDFDFDTSLYQVESIISTDYPNTRCRVLREKCGYLVNCKECKAEKR